MPGPAGPSRLAVTMGDPAGVGPELCLKLLAGAAEGQFNNCVPVVFGSVAVLQRVAGQLGLPGSFHRVSNPAVARTASVYDVCGDDLDAITPGRVSAAGGEAAFRCCTSAIEAGLDGAVAAIVTAPLNKEALHAAGHHYPGHTELFAERLSADHSCMMQYADDIACSFVTTHVGYAEVPGLLTPARIGEVLDLTDAALRRIRGRPPRLLVCGLNPHAGEHGLFGNSEEERLIAPAVAAAVARGIDATGPVPGDTAFTPQARQRYDGVVCMYHDQGHIPVKMIAFDRAVNITLGLPIPRTSVDHGTAFDISWQGKADPGSLFAAVRLAARLT
jgi:4-hydroxythreonine-4-phosphate dehydrogenase